MSTCLQACSFFRMALDGLHDGVTVYDRTGTLVWINTKACEILGLPRAELLGRKVSEIAALPTVRTIMSQEFADRSLADIQQLAQIEDYPSPGYMVFSNGRSMLYTGTDVRDADGALRYAIYTIRDVTDVNEARQQIQHLRHATAFYQEQLRTLRQQVLGRDIVYHSERMQHLVERMIKLARLDGNVLLTGETGVGKNLLARYTHVLSQRATGPFIHVNCASLPSSLVEAELFGYADGAFTGAARTGRRGLIELGHTGTVFLDEIGDMAPEMQAKLLTVIEEKTVRRIGGEKWTPVDVRFLAATNKHPDSLLQHKVLRDDLYYRLAENQLIIPPLRERPEDIALLAEHALAEFNTNNGRELTFQPALVQRLQTLPLPGNVRELKNLVWQLASEVEYETGQIPCSLLPANLDQMQRDDPSHPPPQSTAFHAERVAQESQRLRKLLQEYQGDIAAIANALGVHRTTVTRRLRKYGLAYQRRHREPVPSVPARPARLPIIDTEARP